MSGRSSKSSLNSRRSKGSEKKSSNSEVEGGSSAKDDNSVASIVVSVGREQSGRALSIGALNECVNEGTGTHSIPWTSLTLVVLCVIIHLQIVNIPKLKVSKGCVGLYQVFYFQVSVYYA